jgi:hypothetical protein
MMNVIDQAKRRFHCILSLDVGSFAVTRPSSAASPSRRNCYLQWQPSFYRTPQGHNVTDRSAKVDRCDHHHPIAYGSSP